MHNNCQKKVIPILNCASHWFKKNYCQCHCCSFSITSFYRNLKTKEVTPNENTDCTDDNEAALDSFTDRLVQQKIIKWESLNKIRVPSISRQTLSQEEENQSNEQHTSHNTQEYSTHTCEIVKQFLHECHKQRIDLQKSNQPHLSNGSRVQVGHTGVHTAKDISIILSSLEYKQIVYDLHLAQMMWRNGHFENALNLYWSTYEEHVNARKSIKSTLHTHFADAIYKKGEAVLVLIINFSRKFVKKYNDYALMSYVWEPCFLSTWHSDNQIASDLLEEYPELRDIVQLRVHHITSISFISHKIDIVQRLFEVLLKYDMKTQYELVLRSLFDYACSVRDFYACSAIVQSCHDLDVTLTDIQTARFLNLFCQDNVHRSPELSMKIWSTKPSKFTFKF